MRDQRRRRNRRAGLTLIEVMLVLVILTVLAAALVVNLTNIFGEGLERTASIKVSALDQACQAYFIDVRQFPTDLESLIAPPADLNNPARWKGPYITDKQTPLDPWDQPLMYLYPGRQNPDRFDIWSMGPDQQDGTEDDIGNWQEN